MLPRPILEKLDITYRRVPLLALGKDIYADSARILDELQTRFAVLPTTPADKAYETFGHQIFASALTVASPAALTQDFIRDRVTIFPGLANPEYASLRPSGLAEMRAKFLIIEHEFLGRSPGPFIAGDKFGLADLHAGWAVGWCLNVIGLGQERGFSAAELPRVYEWISSWPKPQCTDLSPEETWDAVLGAEYTAQSIGVDEEDPLGLKAGTEVTVENADTKSGTHPQRGSLVGVDQREVVVELKNGLRLHFPRIGYVVKEAK